MIFDWLKKSSSAAADLYIDLGTANTLVYGRGIGLMLNEPSIIAYTEHRGPGKRKIVGVGLEAKAIVQKTPGNVATARPLRDGVIADIDTTQAMIGHFIRRPEIRKNFSKPRIIISLPHGSSDVERDATRKAGIEAGAKEVFLVDESMASAIGANLPIKEPTGSMIIDIGGGTTEISVIALSDIVHCDVIKTGGQKIDESIQEWLKKRKGVIVSENAAEDIKIELGTACAKKNLKTGNVTGRDIDSGMIKTCEVTSEEIGEAMNEPIKEIIYGIKRTLENTPPELLSDIIESGIHLCGGGALIREMDMRIRDDVRLPVKIVENPLTVISRGGGILLEDKDLLNKVKIRAKQDSLDEEF